MRIAFKGCLNGNAISESNKRDIYEKRASFAEIRVKYGKNTRFSESEFLPIPTTHELPFGWALLAGSQKGTRTAQVLTGRKNFGSEWVSLRLDPRHKKSALGPR
jgi:hypothetical protein